MKSRIVLVVTLILLEGFLSSCTTSSPQITPDYSTTHHESSYYPIRYQPSDNDSFYYRSNVSNVYFNHNGYIGYGGVNMY